MGVGGGWEAEGGQCHPQGDKQQCCVFSRAQKLPQSTWQAETVINSSLTPQTALLVPISGPTADHVVGTNLLCLFFNLLCYAAVLKFLTQYYAHVKELCLKSDCSIRV